MNNTTALQRRHHLNRQAKKMSSAKIKQPKSSSSTAAKRSSSNRLLQLCCLSSTLLPIISAQSNETASFQATNTSTLFTPDSRTIVTIEAMGARSAVSADFDSDGLLDLVTASSNDNAVSWYKNLGIDKETGKVKFSIKNKISWDSKGSRIVTVGDVDNDGDVGESILFLVYVCKMYAERDKFAMKAFLISFIFNTNYRRRRGIVLRFIPPMV